ncbi:MAG TPA: FAD-dependent oxidoreductase [Gemmatimonadales bacterium]
MTAKSGEGRRVDVVVIGGDVNGLVAAHYLARAGRRVVVVQERREIASEWETGWVPPQIIRELGLATPRLRIEAPDPWITAPLSGGGGLALSRDVAKSAEAIKRVSPADAAKWPEFCARMHRLAGVLEALYLQPAPDVESRDVGELIRLGRLGMRVRRLGKQTVIDLLRILPMSIAELLDDWFESDALKGVLGALGVWHLKQGPRSGGTAFNFLHHHVGSAVGVFRPPRSNVREVLEGLPGVEVVQGDPPPARVVVSSADPKTAFEPYQAQLDPEFMRAVHNIKARNCVVRGSLGGTPPGAPQCVAPSLDYLERAYDDAKYGRPSANPYVETFGNEIHVQYAATVDSGLESRVAAALGVPAYQVRLQTPNGHLYHGELTLDQILFMRPVPGWSRYRTPVPELYLCGAGTHPGGGIPGAAGRNAAKVILKET